MSLYPILPHLDEAIKFLTVKEQLPQFLATWEGNTDAVQYAAALKVADRPGGNAQIAGRLSEIEEAWVDGRLRRFHLLLDLGMFSRATRSSTRVQRRLVGLILFHGSSLSWKSRGRRSVCRSIHQSSIWMSKRTDRPSLIAGSRFLIRHPRSRKVARAPGNGVFEACGD